MELVLSYTAATAATAGKLATILNVHRVRRAPATVFVSGRIAETEREVLLPAIEAAGDLTDVNTATYRHARVLRKPPWSVPQPSDRLIAEEITRGALAVREALGRPCRGVRPAEGAGAGFRGWDTNLSAMRDAGLRWSSAYVRSTYGDTAPGDLCGPFRYAGDGYPDLLELPAHGWPDTALKESVGFAAQAGRPRSGRPTDSDEEGVDGPKAEPKATVLGRKARADAGAQQRIVRWPSPFAYPDGLVETPEQELAAHGATIAAARDAGLPYCCLAFDADSTVRPQDPEARVVGMLIDQAAAQGLTLTTLDALAGRFAGADPAALAAPEVPPSRAADFDPGTLFA